MIDDVRSAGLHMAQAVQNRELTGGQWTRLVGGSLLVGYGLTRESFYGLAVAGFGARMLYKLLEDFQQPRHAADHALAQTERPDPVVAADPVDEASWESFPGSDAPARY